MINNINTRFKFFYAPLNYGACSSMGKRWFQEDILELDRQIKEIHLLNLDFMMPCNCGNCEDHDKEYLELKKKLGESVKIALNI